MSAYETTVKVRFGDVDHAGIVYYPRLFHYLHVAMEEFYSERIGLPFPDLLDVRRVGFPVVRTEAEYKRPFRFGDVARVTIDFSRVGTRSMTMRYRVRRGDEAELAFTALVTTACVDMDTFRPIEIPEDLRRAFLAHQTTD